jgi:hypothetical protein
MSGEDEAAIIRIHTRLDSFERATNQELRGVAVALGKLEERVHKQPCAALEELKSDVAKSKERGWQVALKLISLPALGAALAWLIGQSK